MTGTPRGLNNESAVTVLFDGFVNSVGKTLPKFSAVYIVAILNIYGPHLVSLGIAILNIYGAF